MHLPYILVCETETMEENLILKILVVLIFPYVKNTFFKLFNCLNKQIYTNCNSSFNLKNSVNLYMSFNLEVQIEQKKKKKKGVE